jgi:hypothetical protein
MYPHSARFTQTITDDRLANSERRRQMAAMFEGKDRKGWLSRIAGFRPTARRAGTAAAR